jgi:ERCC4-type nuclease
LDILCTIQGVTVEKARILLEEFGSLLEIATCEIKDIMKVKGIGKVTATNISKALNEEQEVKY